MIHDLNSHTTVASTPGPRPVLLTGRACRYHQHGCSNGSNEQCLVQLMLFGSFCSGLWHKGSDLDLTITGRWRNRHGQLLDMVSKGQLLGQHCTGASLMTGQQEPEHD